jgi:hypothetical protein
MIQMPLAWTMEEERRIRDVVERRELPGFFRGYDVEFGQDWAGDPAVTVWLEVDGGRASSTEDMQAVHRFVQDTGAELVELGLSHWPYVRFRVREDEPHG